MKPNRIKKLLWLVFYSLPLVAFAANLTEPRGETVPPQSSQDFSTPIKVIVYKSRPAEFAYVSHVRGKSGNFRRSVQAALAVRAYVEAQAMRFGVNPKLAVWIVKHESSFNPLARGDGEASRGLWQISRIYHPEVTDEAAFSMTSSTEWSLGRIRAGKAQEWSTYRYCRNLYKDCPY